MYLMDKLNQLGREGVISMHVPGHKNMTIGNLNHLGWKNDMTEITGLDDLHSPEGVLLKLNEFLSGKQPGYHAQAMVNGTTGGVLSAIYAVREEVDRFMVVGDAHKSVYHGLDLAGTPFETVSSGELLNTAMENSAVIITYPSYKGSVDSCLAEMIEYVRYSGGISIVDEAHGAHFGMTDKFPRSALESGADIVIQSYHKMLPALTGASVAFTKGKVRHKRMMKYIDYFETSSPSYLILASIELAHQFYNEFDDEVFFSKRDALINSMEDRGFSIIEADDPAKVTVNMDGTSPYTLFDAMDRAGIYSEMVTDAGILWCLPLFHRGDVYPLEALLERLDSLTFKQSRRGMKSENLDFLLGKTAVRSVIPYPPGVPLIHEGERFTEEVVKTIIHKKSYHVKMEGIEDNIESYKVDEDS
jgi:arginine/lysine/ornithine decarboxylase